MSKVLHVTQISQAAFTESLEIVDPARDPAFPIYRVTDATGKIIDQAQDPKFSEVRFGYFEGYRNCGLKFYWFKRYL